MELVVLGAGGYMPDPGFPVPGFVVRHEGVNYLIDAGENTQTRLAKHGISRVKISAALVSHMHGDHTLGLPGVLIRRGQEGAKNTLDLYGPPELENYVNSTRQYLHYSLHYKCRFTVLEDKQNYYLKNLCLTAIPLEHRLETYGFALQVENDKRKFHPEKAKELGVPQGPLWGRLQDNETVELDDGRVIEPEQVSDPPPPGPLLVYITDTRPLENYPEEFQNPDLLIHEGMFLESEREQAVRKDHSTAREAARVAQKIDAGRLLLTHYSRRYGGPEVLAEEAEKLFSPVDCARPGMRTQVN